MFKPGDPARFGDAVKHVELSDDGDVWASFGAEVRIRGEYWRNFNFLNGSAGDDELVLSRVLAHVDLYVGDHLRAFVEGKSALASDRDLPGGRRTSDVNALDLQNAFVEFDAELGEDAHLTLGAGRHEWQFGRGRIVGYSNFSNSSRSTDGFYGVFRHDDLTLTGLWARQPLTQKYRFDDGNGGRTIYGVYGEYAYACEFAAGQVDAYWLGLERPSASFNGDSGEERRQTLGLRIAGKLADAPFDYEVETAWQFGEVGEADARAYYIALELGYTFKDVWATPRVYGTFDMGSGDDDAGDGDVETWSTGLAAAHSALGITDMVGRQNIIDTSLGVSFTPHKKWKVAGEVHHFQRQSTSDAMYDSGGRVLFAGSASDARELGQELLLRVTFKATEQLTFNLGAAHFIAGEFIDEAGGADSMQFVYLEGTWKF